MPLDAVLESPLLKLRPARDVSTEQRLFPLQGPHGRESAGVSRVRRCAGVVARRPALVPWPGAHRRPGRCSEGHALYLSRPVGCLRVERATSREGGGCVCVCVELVVIVGALIGVAVEAKEGKAVIPCGGVDASGAISQPIINPRTGFWAYWGTHWCGASPVGTKIGRAC